MTMGSTCFLKCGLARCAYPTPLARCGSRVRDATCSSAFARLLFRSFALDTMVPWQQSLEIMDFWCRRKEANGWNTGLEFYSATISGGSTVNATCRGINDNVALNIWKHLAVKDMFSSISGWYESRGLWESSKFKPRKCVRLRFWSHIG